MKKLFPVILAAALGGLALTGCGTAEPKAESAAVKTEASAAKPETAPAEVPKTNADNSGAAESKDKTSVRVGGLKGPTTMGLVKLMDWDENGKAANDYEFTMVTAADELTALVAGGKVDIALLPANLASVLYTSTTAPGIDAFNSSAFAIAPFMPFAPSVSTSSAP